MLNLDTTTLYILMLLVSALGLLLLSMVVMYVRLIKKHTDLLSDFTSTKRKEKELQDKLHFEAQVKAQEIIEVARKQAQKLLEDATTFSEADEKSLDVLIEQTKKQYADKYSQLLASFEKKSDQAFVHLSDDVKQYIIKEMDHFQELLGQELKNFHSVAQERFVGAYTKMEQEIDLIKEQRLRRLDERILTIVEGISQDVLGKEISIDEHEKLILKSLEEAKKQHVF